MSSKPRHRPKFGKVDENDPGEESNEEVLFEDLYRAQLFAAVHAQPDSLLAALVHVAESLSVELTITVFVGGQAISGLLVAEAKWLDEVAVEFERAGEGGAGFAEAFRSSAADSQLRRISESVAAEVRERAPYPTILYAHLLSARVHGEAGWSKPGRSIRLRLADVSGWHPGEWRTQ
jgi:hypothetical protein